MTRIDLDPLDRALLGELQRDAAQSNERLSGKIGLSPSAIHRRIRRLVAAGVIERRIAIVDPVSLGHGSLFIVGIEVERERPELVQRLREWLKAEVAVQQVYYVTGSADYVVLVTAKDITSFDALMSRLLADNANVRRFTTNVVMSTIKRGLAVPVD